MAGSCKILDTFCQTCGLFPASHALLGVYTAVDCHGFASGASVRGQVNLHFVPLHVALIVSSDVEELLLVGRPVHSICVSGSRTIARRPVALDTAVLGVS